MRCGRWTDMDRRTAGIGENNWSPRSKVCYNLQLESIFTAYNLQTERFNFYPNAFAIVDGASLNIAAGRDRSNELNNKSLTNRNRSLTKKLWRSGGFGCCKIQCLSEGSKINTLRRCRRCRRCRRLNILVIDKYLYTCIALKW
ncbi:hypothetical protein ABVT39_013317 [Epinephelus coioides]